MLSDNMPKYRKGTTRTKYTSNKNGSKNIYPMRDSQAQYSYGGILVASNSELFRKYKIIDKLDTKIRPIDKSDSIDQLC